MANIQERRNKDGKLISYSIRVHRGRGADGKQLKPWTATFEVSPTWTEKSARKRAEAFAATFEKECREGVASDSRQKFAPYCDYVIDLKEKTGVKHSTIYRYKELTWRIYPAIGHMKLKDIRPDHLNSLYTQLAQPGAGSAHAIAKVELAALLKEKHLTRLELSNVTGVSLKAVYAAIKGERVKKEVAESISTALGGGLVDFFSVDTKERTLSGKTIREYHRLIHTVFDQAMKEGLVAVNVADRATPPKVEQRDVNYFQPEQVAAIREALEQEPIKWKTLVHLLLITGARRGESLGLQWDKGDFNIIFSTPPTLAFMKIPRKQSGQKDTFRSRRRQCSFYGNTEHGRMRNGSAWGNTTRTKVLFSPRIPADPCTRTA